jgi:cation diffusion facilitator family transporter
MSLQRNIRTTQLGLVVNVGLASVKFLAGIFGHSYALIADGIESSTDIVTSLFIWLGLHVSSAPADENHPFGHGKAESVAAASVALSLLGIAAFTAYAAIREALIPHESPASYTLIVLLAVIIIKESLFRKVAIVGKETGSHVMKTDAWHHRSDAISSAAAFIGISIALYKGPGWAAADDWAALAAALVIGINGVLLLLPALDELMDKTPGTAVINTFREAALSVTEVRAVKNVRVLKRGTRFYVDIHVEVDGDLSLKKAHIVSGKVKSSFREAAPNFADSSIHMEPYKNQTHSEGKPISA